MAMKAAADSRDLVPSLLRDRVFRRYWGASTVSMFGDQVSSVAVPLTAVLVLHARAFQMGYLTALEWLPCLLFGLLDTVAIRLQGSFILGFAVPVQLIQSLPYILTVILLAGFIGRAIAPKAIGQPYEKAG